jgi:hypothetical protein
MSDPVLSVVVPAHQAATLLPDTLGALAESDFPRDRWELIVVDDASRDRTSQVAHSFADRVLSLPAPAGGPGRARNAGAAAARGEWLVFVDADVRVHRDTLRRVADAIARHPDVIAAFGVYDDRPEAKGFLSQYRNLLHRYGHLQGAGPAETFWAGLGAVRRDWFHEAGGFDTARFPRPQIEDIELGYRLRDRGGRIVLDPAIQGTHLKRWTLHGVFRTDLRDRGIPWTRLLLERRGRHAPSLNVAGSEPIKVALAGVALAAPVLGLVLLDPRPLLAVPAIGLGLAVWNLRTYRWFARDRGPAFAFAAVPLHLAYYATSAVAALSGLLLYLRDRWRSGARATS